MASWLSNSKKRLSAGIHKKLTTNVSTTSAPKQIVLDQEHGDEEPRGSLSMLRCRRGGVVCKYLNGVLTRCFYVTLTFPAEICVLEAPAHLQSSFGVRWSTLITSWGRDVTKILEDCRDCWIGSVLENSQDKKKRTVVGILLLILRRIQIITSNLFKYID